MKQKEGKKKPYFSLLSFRDIKVMDEVLVLGDSLVELTGSSQAQFPSSRNSCEASRDTHLIDIPQMRDFSPLVCMLAFS